MTGELSLNLLNPAIMAVFAAVFGILGSQRRRQRYLLLLSMAFVCGGLGFFVQGLLMPPDMPEWRLVPNAIFFAAVLLICSSALARAGIAVPLMAFGLIAVGEMAGLSAFFFIHPSLLGRIYVSNAAFGLLIGTTLVLLARARPWDGADWMIGGLAVLGLGLCITRPITASFEEMVVNAGNLLSSGYWLAVQFMAVLMAILVTLGFLLATAIDIFGELQAEARRDPLSGLLNRGGFETLARRCLAEPQDTERPAAMLIADLDDFKIINDTFGHGAGDRVIAAVGQVLREHSAARCAGRIGGEEFALLFTGLTESELRLRAEGLVAAIARLRVAELPPDYRVTLSAGLHMQAGARLAELFAQADTALYTAKRTGKNRVSVSTDAPPIPQKPRLDRPSAA
ncbi:MAG: hypothetical protein ABS76_13525 [Pelagibacterium sp. SCN 64-44]|nr:MAG: hypothetical protein ABS76_13525 [Pelagibacterium sp. SCN 64-44]